MEEAPASSFLIWWNWPLALIFPMLIGSTHRNIFSLAQCCVPQLVHNPGAKWIYEYYIHLAPGFSNFQKIYKGPPFEYLKLKIEQEKKYSNGGWISTLGWSRQEVSSIRSKMKTQELPPQIHRTTLIILYATGSKAKIKSESKLLNSFINVSQECNQSQSFKTIHNHQMSPKNVQ